MHTPVSQLLQMKGTQIYAVAPQDSVYEAVRRMSEYGIGALVVLDGEALAGIVSERDYARKVVLQGRQSKETPVADIMTRNVYTATPTQTVRDCMKLMTERKIRHLPVVDGERVIGMLSIGDLVKQIITTQQAQIEQLQNYIAGQ
ncbi:MAG: CBS domain-containing protein [Xanthomonadales bacterium]|jgi:CBS domain-containing protein|nr:CBS domain-containing protein [Xanthomonadales bacterium]